MPAMTEKPKRPRAGKKPGSESSKPKRSGRSLSVWLPTPLRDALDAYIEAQRFPPELTAIVREALEDWLRKENWPVPEDEEKQAD